MEQIWKEFEQYLKKMVYDGIAPEPTNFFQFIQNLEGRKQLRFTHLSLTLYNNGQVLHTFYFSLMDGSYKMGYALDYLREKLGFEYYGYTEQEVNEACANFLDKFNNQLGGVIMHNELITYDSLKASLKFAKVEFQDGWCEETQIYRVTIRGLDDMFVFEFWEDGSLKSIEEY